MNFFCSGFVNQKSILDIYKCPFLKSGYKTGNDFFQKSDFAWRCSQKRKTSKRFVTIIFLSTFYKFSKKGFRRFFYILIRV